jgi:hypothetical protein
MVKQSPQVQWNGCRLCRPQKHRENGQSARKPLAELRFIGKIRRVIRHDLGDHDPRSSR